MTSKQLSNVPLQMNRVLAGLNNLTARDLTDLEITPQTARALVVLHQHGELRCALMARLLGLEATALSHLLRAMSREQLIVRNRVDNDNRAVEVTLTAQGARVARNCQTLALAHERQLLDGLAPGELAELQRILNKLCDNVTPPERRIKSPSPDPSRAKGCAANEPATRSRPRAVEMAGTSSWPQRGSGNHLSLTMFETLSYLFAHARSCEGLRFQQ